MKGLAGKSAAAVKPRAMTLAPEKTRNDLMNLVNHIQLF